MKKHIIHIVLFALTFCRAYSTEAINKETSQEKNFSAEQNKSPTPLEFSAIEESINDFSFFPDIDDLFRNPAIVNGIELGTRAINRGVNSFMEALFYNMMDREFIFQLTKDSWVYLGLSRKVFTTAKGEYVVVDRHDLGPQYKKQIGEFWKIPISIGADITGSVLDIYLRSDAARVKEKDDLPFYRLLFNNWFGFLPFLEKILPPSFNANELYDPINEITVPFVFPITKKNLNEMPVGSVRSYALSGGVRLPFALEALASKKFTQLLHDNRMDITAPYTIFVEGEYRINVLKNSNTNMWVGLSRRQTGGHKIAGLIGTTFYLLRKALSPIAWTGVPVNISPADIEYVSSLINKYDHLYAYDLTKKEATDAYYNAVKGDFTSSYNLAKKKDSGVEYQFTKKESSDVTSSNKNHHLFLYNHENKKETTQSEIEIEDSTGKYYVLENRLEQNSKVSDVILGEQSILYLVQFVTHVEKEKKSEHSEDFTYVFKNKEKDYSVDFSLNISDAVTDTDDFEYYSLLLQDFIQLSHFVTPKFPNKNMDKESIFLQDSLLYPPNKDILNLRPPTLRLGKFNANAHVEINSKLWEKILQNSDEKIEQVLAKAFNVDLSFSVLNQIKTWTRFTTYPLRIFGLQGLWLDNYPEVKYLASQIRKLEHTQTPKEVSHIFHNIFKTQYPERLLSALYELSEHQNIPREASFFIEPDKDLPPEYKLELKKINETRFQSKNTYIKKERYDIAKDKLAAFFPANLSEKRFRPQIVHTAISFEEKGIKVRAKVKDINPTEEVSFFIKVEKTGSIEIGNFILEQKIIKLNASSDAPIELGYAFFDFYLSGEDAFSKDFILEKAFNLGGVFLLSLSTSRDERIWSKEFAAKFNYWPITMP